MATENKCPHCGKPVPGTALGGICPECMLKVGLTETAEVGPDGTVAAKASSPPPVSEIAPHFPQLEILECLGRGGMGVVYKARQPKLDRFVALKILSRKRADGPSDAEFAERFQREARALARLNHPDIIAVYDFGEAGGFHYLLMEYVDGLTLRQLLETRKLSPEEALTIVPKICEALQFAHQRGIVHRDIKPENILLDRQGCVKIADFGIAKIVGVTAERPALTGAKDVLGTPHYMAPEQLEKPATVDHRADIYSLGVVFYEMLTGELPLGKFQPPSRKVHVDVRLDEVVLHTLEKEPERRYQHASEVKSDVETIAATPAFGSGVRESAPSEDQSRLRSAATIHSMVKAPANWLVATGILNWIAIPLIIFVTMGIVAGKGGSVSPAPALLIPLSVMILSSAMIVAGFKMKRLEAYSLAIVGSILAILITPGNLIGLPVGIWSLVMLCRREVREAFGKGHLPSGATAPPPGGGHVARGKSPQAPAQAPAPRNQTWSRSDSTRVIAARWTARVFGTLLLAFYAFFILAEGLPPIAAQPEGVQLNFIALGLMLAGFVAGWKREGTAALLIACGWTLWQISEGWIKWNLFQTPLPVAMLYGYCWWATRGRRTGVVMGVVVGLLLAFGLGYLFLPTSVFVRGVITDAQTGQAVPNVEFRLLPRTPRGLEKGDLPNAHANQNGRFTLYVGWFTSVKQVAISAPAYATLTTNLGPRGLGARNLTRNFQLQPVAGVAVEPKVPPVVIHTIPESGTANVDPAMTDLQVTFSKAMREGSWSWTIWGEDNFPETTGSARYLADGRTCVLPVKLKPGKLYAIWLNSEHHLDFKDREGQPAVPYLLIFETRK